jgi:hypothetical protein
MNIKTKFDSPNVTSAASRMMAKPPQWPLKSGGKNPKKNTVQENPTGASFTWPVCEFSKYIFA